MWLIGDEWKSNFGPGDALDGCPNSTRRKSGTMQLPIVLPVFWTTNKRADVRQILKIEWKRRFDLIGT